MYTGGIEPPTSAMSRQRSPTELCVLKALSGGAPGLSLVNPVG
jgi:hypothetical protein